MSLSGAMTPVGFGGIFKSLIERGRLDGMHLQTYTMRSISHGIRQGHHEVDDAKLYENEIVPGCVCKILRDRVTGSISRKSH